MRIQLISMSALASLTVLSANGQTAGASAGSGISVGGPAPVVPALQQRQAVTPPVPPTQLPVGQASQVPSGTVSSTAINPTTGATQDQAVTAADQEVLARVRQRIVVRSGGGAWGPVNFSVANGVVTVTGQAENPAAQQQLEALVKSTPGVVAVLDQLNTTSPTAAAATTTGQSGTAVSTPNSGSISVAGAMSPADQILLLRVRQSVVPQIQVAGQPVPVNFTVQQGMVTVNGSVASLAQKRQIAALVQQVPGVMQVSDQVRVGVPGTLPQPGLGAIGTAVSPTETTTSPNANLTPTGRTNGVAVPAGLQPRTDLPPGLEPKGLGAVTNTSGSIR